MFSKLCQRLIKNKYKNSKNKIFVDGGMVNVRINYCGYVFLCGVEEGQDESLGSILLRFKPIIDTTNCKISIDNTLVLFTDKIRSFNRSELTLNLLVDNYNLIRGINVNCSDNTVKLPFNELHYGAILTISNISEILGFYIDEGINFEVTRFSTESLYINEADFIWDEIFVEIDYHTDRLRLMDYACNRARYCFIGTNWESLLEYQGICSGWKTSIDIEAFILGLYQLAHARTKAQIFATALLLVKLYTGKKILDNMQDILIKISQCIIFTQSESKIDEALDIINNYEDFKKSEFFKNAYVLMSVMIAKMAGDVEYSDKFMTDIKEAGLNVINGSPDFPIFITKTVLLLFKRLQQAIVLGSFRSLCYDDFTIEQWVKDVKELEMLSSHYNNLLPFKSTPEEFRLKLEAALLFATDLKRAVSSKYTSKKFVGDLYNKLLNIQCKIKAIDHCSKERDLPFALLFTGAPGIGKSSLVDIAAKIFCDYNKLECKREYFHFAIKDSDYDDGYKSYKFIWVADDIGQDNPRRVQGVDKEVTRLINIINKVPLMANMPDVDSKGVVPIVPKLVIGTSNIPDIHAPIYCAKPYAALRRFNIIVNVKVQPRFADRNGRLDTHKVSLYKGMPDWWIFEFRQPVRVSSEDRSAQERINLVSIPDDPRFNIFNGRTTSIEDFIRFMYHKLSEHNRDKQCQDDFSTFLNGVKFCDECRTWMCEHVDPDCYYKTLQSSNELTPERRVAEENFPDLVEYQSDEPDVRMLNTSPALMVTLLFFMSSYIKMGDHIVEYTWTRVGHTVTKLLCLTVFTVFMNPLMIFIIWPLILYWILKALENQIDQALENSLNVLTANLTQDVRNWFLSAISSRAEKYLSPMATTIIISVVFVNYHFIFRLVRGALFCVNALCIKPEADGRVSGPSDNLKDVSKTKQWIKSDDRIAHKMFTDKSWSLGQRSRADIVKYFENNVARIYFQTESKPVVTNIFSLGGNTWIINKHSFDLERMNGIVRYEVKYMNNSIKATYSGELDLRMVAVIDDMDACIFSIPGISPRKAISDILTNVDKNVGKIPIDGLYIGRDDDGNTKVIPTKKIIPDNPPAQGHPHLYWRGDPLFPTIKGDCGSLLIYHDQVVCILGYHTLGNLMGTHSWATPILPSLCQRISSNQLQIGDPHIVDNDTLIAETNETNITSYVDNVNDLELLGTLDTYVANAKTTTGPTVMAEFLEQNGITTSKVAPNFKGPNRYMPFNILINHIGFNNSRIPLNFLNAATMDLCTQLINGDISGIKMLSWEEAINGIPGCRYIDAMMKSTSGGYGFPGAKIDHMFQDESGKWSMKDHVMKEVNIAWSKYASSKTYGFIFKTALKDEPISPEKNESGNIRVFNVCPTPFVLITRKIFMTFIKYLQENRQFSEVAVGINAHGVEWENLLKYLNFDEELSAENLSNLKIMAGDFKKFDLSMHTETLVAVTNIIMAVLSQAGWNISDLTVAHTCLNELIFKYILVKGEIVLAKHSNPSGNSLTVIINCLANSLYHRAVYYKLMAERGEEHIPPFSSMHRLITYGDDSILSSIDGDEVLNHITMHETLKEWNIGYTMADKSDDFVKFIPLEKATFLKRSFVWSKSLNRYVAPLDINSIDKMLCICTYTKCGWSVQLEGTIRSAFSELLFHGEREYEKYREIILKFLDQSPYTWNHPVFKNEIEVELGLIWRPPPYQEMVIKWFDNNRSDLQLLGDTPSQM